MTKIYALKHEIYDQELFRMDKMIELVNIFYISKR